MLNDIVSEMAQVITVLVLGWGEVLGDRVANTLTARDGYIGLCFVMAKEILILQHIS